MELIPAIDIRGGRCVRLQQGDYSRETVFGDDPVAVAKRWRSLGATRLHVVDLDGARDGRPANTAVIVNIAAALDIPVQVGGGIRTEESARAYIEAGVARVIVGTSAVEDRSLVARLAQALGEALVVGVDARDGIVMTRGWLSSGEVNALDFAAEMRALGVGRFVYTDIARDGTLSGPNLPALRAFVDRAACPVIASGGVSSLADVLRVRDTGAEAVIAGIALYTGALDLVEALRTLRDLDSARAGASHA